MHAVLVQHCILARQQYLVRDALILYKLLNHVGIFTDVDSHHRQVRIVSLKLLEKRYFFPAGCAPGSPEIEKHGFAAQTRKLDIVIREIAQGEIRGRFAGEFGLLHPSGEFEVIHQFRGGRRNEHKHLGWKRLIYFYGLDRDGSRHIGRPEVRGPVFHMLRCDRLQDKKRFPVRPDFGGTGIVRTFDLHHITAPGRAVDLEFFFARDGG